METIRISKIFNIADYRKCLRGILEGYGFESVNNRMRILDGNTLAIVELQKSNYSDAFYINCGFYVPSIHAEPADVKAVTDCDVGIRFEHGKETEKDTTLFDIKTTGLGAFSDIVQKNIDEIIVPVMKNGIQVLFEMEPDVIHCTKKDLRRLIENKAEINEKA